MKCNSKNIMAAVVFGWLLYFCEASAQTTCIDGCNCSLESSTASCEADYQTCLAQAGGDPELVAACAAQRNACLSASNNAFVACARQCPATESCTLDCGLPYGFAITACNDQYAACLPFGTPESCGAAYDACTAAAFAQYSACLLARCVRPPVCSCEAIPCVSIAANPTQQFCPSAVVTATGTVTNCGLVAADIEIYIDGQLAALHEDVAPGAVVVGSRDIVPLCSPVARYDVRAVARTACADPHQVERRQFLSCACSDDCLTGQVSMSSLWPPNGQLVFLTVFALNAGGQHTNVCMTGVTSDEPNSGNKGCVDAILDPNNGIAELRAQRSAMGGGRVYRLSFEDLVYGCPGEVSVCVPATKNNPCIDDGQLFDPRLCVGRATTGGDLAPVTVRPVGSGIEIVVSEAVGKRIGIEVFDARGRRVARLEPRLADDAGLILWNGSRENGEPAAAGVYLVRTTVDNTMYSAKTVLVR